jgi:HK97 family phage portal protein
MMWLICWGNAYAWMPAWQPGQRREIFILKADRTQPVYDLQGNLWYQTSFDNGRIEYLPAVEVLHLLINSADGITGKSVISYARESLGRQMGARETQGKFYDQGLNPGGIMWMNGEANKEAREKVRESYASAMSGSSNAYRLAVMDNKVAKFETITMKPVDAQFLESIQDNDVEIANFFGMPLYKLNMGKQSYESNEQQNLDYLTTTLDPYLVQFEQAAALKWLSEEEQGYVYFRFNRDVLLRTDAKTRAEYLQKKIMSGQLSPNEARAIEDMPAYTGGDDRYIPANMTKVGGPTNG